MPPLFLPPDEKSSISSQRFTDPNPLLQRKYWIFLELNRRQVLESILLQLFLPSADESFYFRGRSRSHPQLFAVFRTSCITLFGSLSVFELNDHFEHHKVYGSILYTCCVFAASSILFAQFAQSTSILYVFFIAFDLLFHFHCSYEHLFICLFYYSTSDAIVNGKLKKSKNLPVGFF